jgi:hypothetical protein
LADTIEAGKGSFLGSAKAGSPKDKVNAKKPKGKKNFMIDARRIWGTIMLFFGCLPYLT